jgi:hypothetical protein
MRINLERTIWRPVPFGSISLGTFKRTQRFRTKQERASMPATPKQKRKVETVMHEFKVGNLHSSSGAKVKQRNQAIAIALSESEQSRKSSKRSTKIKKTAV